MYIARAGHVHVVGGSGEAVHAQICRVGQDHTFIGIYGVHAVFLAGKSPYIRSYTVQTYGSGQP